MKFKIEFNERDSGLWDWKMQPMKSDPNGKPVNVGPEEVGLAETLVGAMDNAARVADVIRRRSV